MFNKRENPDQENDTSTPRPDSQQSRQTSDISRPAASGGQSHAAAIGPSIQIDGELKGNEDLRIDGQVNGTVYLKNNSLTIGNQGKVSADVYANSITIEGQMKGDMYAAERVSIRKSAKIKGNIHAPKVSLEEGGRFKGSIEMDPEADALKRAFHDSSQASVKKASPGPDAGTKAADRKPSESKPDSTGSDKRGNGAAAKTGMAG